MNRRSVIGNTAHRPPCRKLVPPRPSLPGGIEASTVRRNNDFCQPLPSSSVYIVLVSCAFLLFVFFGPSHVTCRVNGLEFTRSLMIITRSIDILILCHYCFIRGPVHYSLTRFTISPPVSSSLTLN